MRYKYLDVAKGITIVFVLMAHSCGFPFGLGGYCTAYFMSLYFMVSGYTQKNLRFDKNYLYRRVKKIIFPYFYYNVFIFLIYFIWKGFASAQEAVEAVAGMIYSTYCIHFPINIDTDFLCYRIYNEATWFLTAFFCADILFALYRKYCVRIRDRVAIFLLFAIITQILYYCPIFLPWNMDKAFIGADFMILGYEMKRKSKRNISFEETHVIPVVLFVVTYIVLVNFNPGINLSTREYGNRGIFSVSLYLVVGYVGSMLCIWASKYIAKIKVIGFIFELLGREVLPIMAMHLILYRIFDQILSLHISPEMRADYYWWIAFARISITCTVIIGVVYGIRYFRKTRRKEIYLG